MPERAAWTPIAAAVYCRSLYIDEWEPNRKALERLRKNKSVAPLRSGIYKGFTVLQAIAVAEQHRGDLLTKKKRLEVWWLDIRGFGGLAGSPGKSQREGQEDLGSSALKRK